jgi:FAD dependent oxidoreductase TIGR03364
MDKVDLVVVGAGIVGLAMALTGARRGLKVAVIERDHRCVGASIRNFGFITVTGQREGTTWRRALRSRDLWAELAPQAGIDVLHRGLWVLARRPLAADVLHAFSQTEMGRECRLMRADEAAVHAPELRTEGASAALFSPHELRVESRTAIPALAQWLSRSHGVQFHWGQTVLGIEDGRVHTASGEFTADRVALCPGTELTGPALPLLADLNLRLTRLQMMRVRPDPGFGLGAAVMADLSLVRYAGYAALPQAAPLLKQLQQEVPASLDAGIHLIAVQSADGSLVVGDSHHDHHTPEPFAQEAVDRLILGHLQEAVRLKSCEVVERWTGVYPTGHSEDAVIRAPGPDLRVVVVTSGTGASTAFGLAEDVFNDW